MKGKVVSQFVSCCLQKKTKKQHFFLCHRLVLKRGTCFIRNKISITSVQVIQRCAENKTSLQSNSTKKQNTWGSLIEVIKKGRGIKTLKICYG